MRKVIFDCDTGGDDACAVTLAVASKELEVLGVTAVMGNLKLDYTYRNARQVIGYLGVDVPVLKGNENPLVRDRWTGSDEDWPIEIPSDDNVMCPESELDAVSWLKKTLEEADEPVTLVPLAPLTNIAKLMLFYPELVKEKVGDIVIMGGGYAFGNSTGAAELNIYADPEAAQVVFSFGKPVVMCGLDVCHNAYIKKEENEKFGQYDTRAAKLFYSITKGSFDWFESPEFERFKDAFKGAIIFDTVPVIYLLHPEIFQTKKVAISVECGSEMCDGATICTSRMRGPNARPLIHTVVLDVDREAYIEAVDELLRNSEV